MFRLAMVLFHFSVIVAEMNSVRSSISALQVITCASQLQLKTGLCMGCDESASHALHSRYLQGTFTAVSPTDVELLPFCIGSCEMEHTDF